jgi:hypothetical protein
MISILVVAALLAQQASASVAAKARVEGSVINSLNGETVRKAIVVLRAHDRDHGLSYAGETDGNGHFSIDDVEPGEYAVTAERPGFFLRPPGSTGAPPPDVKVEKDQSVSDIAIRLTPLGVISGRVLDADGDPVRGATVNALRYAYSAGKKELRNVEEVQSNDQGDFRLFGLRPGTFYLKASLLHRGAPGPQDTSSYYPATVDESHAAPIELRAGAQLRGFDIRLQATGLYSIRFELERDSPESRTAPAAYLVSSQGFVDIRGQGWSPAGLVFQGVPPGSYEAVVNRTDGEKQSYAIQPVEVVNADVDGGTLTFVPAAEVTGSVRVEGGPSSGIEKLSANLRPVRQFPSDSNRNAPIGRDGSFRIRDVAPGVYEVSINGPTALYLKSVRMGDKQLTDRRVDLALNVAPLLVVLGADVGEVEGSVRNAKGEPVVRARVNAIAYGDHLGRIDLHHFTFTDDKGEFKIKDVAPGEYKIFAWEDVPVGAPQDPGFRKPFENQAATVRMRPNAHEKVQVTAIPASATRSEDQ